MFAVLSGSETIENKEVSSANNLTLDFKSVKKKESKIDPSSTHARIHS